jgi:putative hydrolase of HD superfamily
MQRKAELSAALVERLENEPLLATFVEAIFLKQLFRQGWLKAGVPREVCESVAEHSFGVALLAMFTADEGTLGVDRERTVRMALVHDLGEVYAGDMIPADAVPAQEKHRLEAQAVEKIFSKLPHGDRYQGLWEEYERNETPEARLVHDLDRLEMALQALVYEEQGAPDLDIFFISAKQAVQSQAVSLRLDSILRNRSRLNGISEDFRI